MKILNLLVFLIFTSMEIFAQDSTMVKSEPMIYNDSIYKVQYTKVLEEISYYTYKTKVYSDEICSVWYGSIHDNNYKYKGKKCKDFNEALSMYFSDRAESYSFRYYKEYYDELKDLIKSIRKNNDNAFDEILYVGSLLDEYREIVLDPNGSYKSFSEKSDYLYTTIKRKLYRIEMKYAD